MFLGHIAVGLAGKRAAPGLSLATWIAAAQFVDLLWPIMLLLGLEHVRIAPGITAVTPFDFYDYPITHSLVGGLGWAAVFVIFYLVTRTRRTTRIALLLAGAVLSHWVLDVIAHRPDMPVLPHGPYLGLGLWNSIPATLVVEFALFAAGIFVYMGTRPDVARRISFWILIGFLVVAYLAATFGPPPPDVHTLAVTGLSMWLLIPWLGFVDRTVGSRQSGVGSHSR
ncbi:MAG TPA: hypothetical protein VHI99_11080 [Vicinamibacterales bacterium]|jgi:hypothetical protein|nr:hypothetical protein [Vicinamibacterales bacterium]